VVLSRPPLTHFSKASVSREVDTEGPADRQPRARQTGYEPGGSAGPGPGSERRWCRPTGHAEHVRPGNGLLGKLEQVVLVIAAILLTAAAVVPGPGT
jgi:hypothetical protein